MAALKRISGIILCLLAILLMSHNTYALELTQDVYLVRGSFRSQIMTDHWNSVSCTTSPSADVWVNEISCPVGVLRLYDIYLSIPQRTYTTGDWIVFQIEVWSPNGVNQNYSNFTGLSYGGSNPVDVVDVEVESLDNYSGLITVYTTVYGTFSDSNLRFVGAQGTNGIIDIVSTSGSSGAYIRPSTTTVWHSVSNNTQGIIDAINNNSAPSADDIADAINDGEQEATQDAADEAQDAADDSSSDASTATSSLISVIGGFVNVLTSAQPTNCKINANLNHIDMGQLDLCANPVPSYIQIIGSIILICAAIPLAIVLFNRFIGLFRSFQG